MKNRIREQQTINLNSLYKNIDLIQSLSRWVNMLHKGKTVFYSIPALRNNAMNINTKIIRCSECVSLPHLQYGGTEDAICFLKLFGLCDD